MDDLVQHFRTNTLKQQAPPTKDDHEHRYTARIGPIMTPEPEFGDLTQSAELFSIDPHRTLLMASKESIDTPIEEMQHHHQIF